MGHTDDVDFEDLARRAGMIGESRRGRYGSGLFIVGLVVLVATFTISVWLGASGYLLMLGGAYMMVGAQPVRSLVARLGDSVGSAYRPQR